MTNPAGSKWIRPTKRLRIYVRDEWRCVWCGECTKDRPRSERTLDHVMARSYGGTNDHVNLVTACTPCNNMRKDRTAPVFARVLARTKGAFTHAAIDEAARLILLRVHRAIGLPLPPLPDPADLPESAEYDLARSRLAYARDVQSTRAARRVA